MFSTTHFELVLIRLNDCAVELRMSNPPPTPLPPVVFDGTIVIGNDDGSVIMLSMESGSSSMMPGRMNSLPLLSSRRSTTSSDFENDFVLVRFFFTFSLSTLWPRSPCLISSVAFGGVVERNGNAIASNSLRNNILYFISSHFNCVNSVKFHRQTHDLMVVATDTNHHLMFSA